MKEIIPKGTSLAFARFRNDGVVCAKALEIAESTKSANRTKHQIFEDAINGLSLEAAVLDYLSGSPRFIAAASNDYVYDLKVHVDDKSYLIDIKGRFKPNARTYTQSSWEKKTLEDKKLNVYYMCFNCTDGVNAIYEGHALSGDFQESLKYTGFYIYGDQLR